MNNAKLKKNKKNNTQNNKKGKQTKGKEKDEEDEGEKKAKKAKKKEENKDPKNNLKEIKQEEKNKINEEELLKLPLQERLKIKSKMKDETNQNNLKMDENMNLHKLARRKRDDNFDLFDEDPIPKTEKEFSQIKFNDNYKKANKIMDVNDEREVSTNSDDKIFKF